MEKSNSHRWLTLAIISISGGVSFGLAYLRYIYQIPMAKFMGFSSNEMGLIMSTFGITAIILYASSGVIADKFSHRKMMTFTCYASRGLYFACIGEARTPKYIVGTTVGICSVIGFLPDVFVYPVIGHWQDTLPAAEAYHNMWLMGLSTTCLVVVFTFLLFNNIKRVDNKNTVEQPVTESFYLYRSPQVAGSQPPRDPHNG
ncbi:MFS transporter [Serratia sp. DD3]|uniref:MFS transporter n=1 Tax=Serratia sp. DD3 TaxID=1410619 RepID=UPI0003C51A93|nr:MFS transporter [Serratia sp. DD3]KEY60054.1 inner membrane protein YqcE [Serratia sp. DD3]